MEENMPLMVIENNEEELSEWLLLEYKHSLDIWENILFSNIPISWKQNSVFKNSITKHIYDEFNDKTFIVLDPVGRDELSPTDFYDVDGIIVGGILGNEKFTGKTKKYITDNVRNKKVRNLGKIQLPIDIAVFVTKMIYLGVPLKSIELTKEVELEWDEGDSTILPYGYPIIDGKIIITPGLIEYLKKNR
jgi:ribosome biogenesis SPOUT family RNA methylase Rps3